MEALDTRRLDGLISHKEAVRRAATTTGNEGFDYFQLRRQIQAGRIEAVKLPDGNTAIVRKSLDHFLSERARK